jgi:cell division protein FtsA
VLTRRKSAIRASDVIGVLDIGTSKTICLVAAAPDGRSGGLWRRDGACVLGFGLRPSRGLKAGVVIEPDGAEQALRAAVSQAEQMAGETIEDVFVAVTGGRLKSTTFEAEARIEDGTVSEADTDRLLAAGRQYVQRDGHALLHLNHIGYRLDGEGGVVNPCGLAATMLAADLHAVTIEDAPLRNLLHVVERAYLSPAGIVPGPYASGLAATTDQERRLGTTCIDMGAGATTLSMFGDGQLLSIDTVAVGGHHVTFDIARTLSIPFPEAERIKTLYGTLDSAATDDEETVGSALASEREPALFQSTRAELHDIVTSRMSDLLAQVVERIERSGVGHLAAHRVVLTGGGSQLPGLGRFAQEALARPVRNGRPQPLPGMPALCCSPLFSTAVGLMQIALEPAAGVHKSGGRHDVGEGGYLKRVGQWLREGLGPS